MNIVRQHRKFVNVGIVWRVFLAPRGCFGDVFRSPKFAFFCEALVLRMSSWSFLESSLIILDRF